MELKEALRKVEAEKMYSLTEIAKKHLIPHAKSYPTAYRIVLEDQTLPEDKQTIKAQILGEGKARTIRIKGENLIAYLRKNKERVEKA
jgi:hypothetical protein